MKKPSVFILNLILLILIVFVSFENYDRLLRKIYLKKGCIIHFIDVNQGDSILIETRYGRKVLIDGGEMYLPSTNINIYEKKLKRYLKRYRIDDFDAVILTHPHSDHLGGLVGILKEYNVGVVFDRGFNFDSFLYKRFLKLIRLKRKKVVKPYAGREIVFECGARLLFLSPPKNLDFGNVNDNSLVSKFIYGKNSFLLMADAGKNTEKWLLANMKKYLKSIVLKIGHHGSLTSSSEEFLKEVHPSYCVFTVGKNNPFGFPKNEILKRVKKISANILLTDIDGNIVFYVDRKNVFFKCKN